MVIGIEQAAEQAAGNWKKQDNFVWFDKPEDPDRWCIWTYQHRDSEPLDRANAEAIDEALECFISQGTVRRHSASHWAVGWVEGVEVMVYTKRGKITKAFEAVYELQRQLEDYPVLDEDRLCELEHEEITEAVSDWLAREAIQAAVDYGKDDEAEFVSEEAWEHFEFWADNLEDEAAFFFEFCEESHEYPEHSGREVHFDTDKAAPSLYATLLEKYREEFPKFHCGLCEWEGNVEVYA